MIDKVLTGLLFSIARWILGLVYGRAQDLFDRYQTHEKVSEQVKRVLEDKKKAEDALKACEDKNATLCRVPTTEEQNLVDTMRNLLYHFPT